MNTPTEVLDLEERLTRPSTALIEDMGRLDGDILVLGAAGKMGPTLVGLAARAIEAAGSSARVVAVSRYGQPGSDAVIRRLGGEPLAADVMDDAALAALPDFANVIYMVGAKFGTTGQEHPTWMTNAYLPGRVAQRYPDSRIAALSTGNVYPLTPIDSGGSTELDTPDPIGEYAMSCLGRERVLSHFSHQNQTPMSIIRLNYAVEPRYGVIVDLATSVLEGSVIDLTMGHVNVVWQGFANEVVIRSLIHASVPPFVVNLTGTETIATRDLATKLGVLLDRQPNFVGEEAPTALLSNASRCAEVFGAPGVGVDEVVEMVADWVLQGGPLLGKPTHFSTRDGRF